MSKAVLRCSDSSALCHCHMVCSRGSAPASASGWRSNQSAKIAVKCSVAAVAATCIRTSRWAFAAMRFKARSSMVLRKPCWVRWLLNSVWIRLCVASWPTKPATSAAKRPRSASGKDFRPLRTESMKYCSPTGKLIDSALKNADRNASPPFQCFATGLPRSISRRRTTSSLTENPFKNRLTRSQAGRFQPGGAPPAVPARHSGRHRRVRAVVWVTAAASSPIHKCTVRTPSNDYASTLCMEPTSACGCARLTLRCGTRMAR